MTDAPVLEFRQTTAPTDETPPPDDTQPVVTNGDFDPEYPGSTEEAPYGYTPTGRIRKRPVANKSSAGSGRRMPASESSAKSAAGLLARMNEMIAASLTLVVGLPNTGAALIEGNKQFEAMAFEALLTDPALCRKILSAGSTSGKAGLALAYGMLGMGIVPAAFAEVRERKQEVEE